MYGGRGTARKRKGPAPVENTLGLERLCSTREEIPGKGKQEEGNLNGLQGMEKNARQARQFAGSLTKLTPRIAGTGHGAWRL